MCLLNQSSARVETVMLAEKRHSLRSQPEWIREGIWLGNQWHYRQKHSLRHNSLNLAVLLVILTGVGSLGYLGTLVPPIFYIPLAAVGFGWFYFLLFILVVHEASHNMFLIGKNLKQVQFWNRLCGWLVCLPFGVDYIQHWEIGHQIHHLQPVEPQDPQNCPETVYTGRKLLTYLTKVLLIPGYAILKIDYACPAEQAYDSHSWLRLGSIMTWMCALSLEAFYWHWAVAVAAGLGIQMLVAFNTLKVTMEHGGSVGRQADVWRRSCSSFFPARIVGMPLNISLHFEHHLNYCVPWYDLIRYHHHLQPVIPPEIRAEVYNSNGQVWQQITATPHLE
jgi:fatty acid desaturase